MSKQVTTLQRPTGLPLPGLLTATTLFLVFVVAGGTALLSLRRVFYPYSIDFIEDAMLLQAWRYARGMSVYLPPNAEFVPQVYMPLYTWLASWMLRLTGPLFWPLRLFSWLSSVGTAVLLYLVARRMQPHTSLAAACGVLFLAGFRLVGGGHDLVRVDPLFTLLVLAGMSVAILGRQTRRGLVFAGILMGLSLLTKQNGLFLAIVVGAWLLATTGWRAGFYLLTATAVTLPILLYLNGQTDGWFAYYVVNIAYASPLDPTRIWPLLQREFLGSMGGLLLAGGLNGLFLLRRFGPRSWAEWIADDRLAWLLFMGAGAFVSLAGRTSVGGSLNNLIIGLALLCLAPALLASWLPDSPWVYLLVLLQGGLLLFPPLPYAPRRFWPSTEMVSQGHRLVAELATIDGEVWVMLLPHLAQQAGKEPGVHIQTLWHARQRGQQPLPTGLVEQIENQAFARIISTESVYFEKEPAFQELLDLYYVARPLDPALAPPTMSGIVVRPQLVYTPRLR